MLPRFVQPHSTTPELTPSVSPFVRFMLAGRPSLNKHLFDFLPWPDVIRLSYTSTLVKQLVKLYKEEAWSVERFFTFWFPSRVYQLRALLALTGAIVTGSQIVRFLDRDIAAEREPLVIVTRVAGAAALVLFLEGQGYMRSPDTASTLGNSHSTMAQIFELASSPSFRRKDSTNGILATFEYTIPLGISRLLWAGPTYDRYASVQVVIVSQNPVYHMLMSFHSTGEMNFMTQREVISMFPYHTFIERVIYICSRDDLGYDFNPHWVHKYKRLGFKVEMKRADHRVKLGLRSVKDRHCWVIPFLEHETVSIQELVKSQEARSIYGPYDAHDHKCEVVWMSEIIYGTRQWRLGVFEPKMFWYLIKSFEER